MSTKLRLQAGLIELAVGHAPPNPTPGLETRRQVELGGLSLRYCDRFRCGQPPLGLSRRDSGSEGRADRGDGGVDRRRKRPTSTERKGHYGDDTSRDDKVFERHHAVLIRAQTLQCFRGLNTVLQHRRNPYLQDEFAARRPDRTGANGVNL